MLRRALPSLAFCRRAFGGLRRGAPQRLGLHAGRCFPAPAGSGALFVFSGHGWGHGVGMSQYGAYGYALHGATSSRSSPTTTRARRSGRRPATKFRVLLATARRRRPISSDGPVHGRRRARRQRTRSPPARSRSAPSLALDAAQALTAPLTFTPGTGGPLTLGRPYRGQIQVDVVDGKLRAINIVPLEQYLYGVVPSEMPSTWSAQALEAQAVASRSYALATRQGRRAYDVYSDTRSQMYLGISAEIAGGDRSRGRDEGPGALVRRQGRDDVLLLDLGRRDGVEPRLDRHAAAVSRRRPGSVRRSRRTTTGARCRSRAQTISKALKVPGPITDATTTTNAAGRVGKLTLSTPARADERAGVDAARRAIGLRSTWFTRRRDVAPGAGAQRARRRTACRSRSPAPCAASPASRSSSAPTGGTVAARRPGRSRRAEADAASRRSRPTTGSRRRPRPQRVRAHPRRAADPADVVHDGAGRRHRSSRCSRARRCRCSSRPPTRRGRRSQPVPSTPTAPSRSRSRSRRAATYRVVGRPGDGVRGGHHAAADRGSLMRRLLPLLAARGARCRGAGGGVHADGPARREAVVPRSRITPSTRGRSRRRRSPR